MLYRGARILIMDEPTAVLAPQEIDELFPTLRSMTAAGRSVVFISHKLGEVLAIADRITVMRRGQVTAAGMPAAGRRTADLARLMVGRDGPRDRSSGRRARARRRSSSRSRTSSADNDRGLPALRGVTLDGPRGRDRRASRRSPATARASWPRSSPGCGPARGAIRIDGERGRQPPPRDAIRRGVAHVPEDRTGVGSAPNLSLVDNLIMKRYREPPIARGWLVDDAARARASPRSSARALRDRGAVDRHARPGCCRAATSSG